jgi:hypothetical protein
MRDSNVADAAKESAQAEFPHGLIEIKTVRELIDWKAGTLPDAAFLISPETGLVSSFKDLQAKNWGWSAVTKLHF